jgi:hypothetical protein
LEVFVRQFYGFGLAATILVGLWACSIFQETPQQRAERIEPMLSAAGFKMKQADTPERVAKLNSLPSLKVRYTPKDGKFIYWLADPKFCNCLYVGDEAAYQQYQKLRLQAQIAQQQRDTAEMNQEAAMDAEMNWGMWGPWY